ncbi:MAG: Glycosyl transferase group 1 [Candidatus Falkowbacteria bacterium GW2011_GWC2_38_22]|uniref:Glycosyl transferase group 1 n=1 Tax=Candidatus Falkowbacteria bacterium GW2011_GWE1_38_31 TaxID=1618638 RepID=A0A0G0MXJ6_9BACT|nr:MAG: Glycosyl transferase group 1 [Candidatus Falkowbacteria bacterium GW2011_GWF2_38_1205]KKQ60679.1 MAG: Glycosyl transferase group 1 [Candidatus Falkowbacteria bacterium GW2011_GWC2_38_22]KKQ62819.1 MAG: Glycosyl transferase group 1 [Candidatus Falkowbacteria bacterium GW2011_GWF1_38_22]KKQ64931.1 MAG: Glycosyl transferase group 1 [Candidatus Falkowbacteria bacterium GW2011_GWE2_38_254]KKQ69651.1 MAG: Glycosyl transferase group 1 [Candidatus Falkowbacteria bacterium GW2011_GWE1_38_31]KKQ
MKTILITIEYPPFKGGVANYYANLVKYWPVQDEISVLDNSDNQLLCGNFWPKWLPAIFLFYKTIKQNQVDKVIVGQLLPLGFVVYLVSLFYKINYCVIVHGMEIVFAQRRFRKKFISRLILNKAEQIICPGKYTASLVKDFLKKSDDKKISVVNPGVSPIPLVDAKILEKIKIENNLSDKIVLFTVSRLVRRKGHDMVITAMKELAKIDQHIHYYLGGTGPDEADLKSLARGMENVHFLGKLSDEEKWAWLVLSQIFIMPSRNIAGDFEGFGIVYLEAAIAGLPVIAGDSGGIRDAVVDGETGFVADPTDVNQIAQSILKLSKDEMLRKKLGETGRARAMRDFDWEAQVQKIYSIINNQ